MNSLYASQLVSQVIWPDFTAHFKSHTTEASYRTDISEIMEYFHKDFLEIEKYEIQEYYNFLKHKVEQKEIRPATMAKKFRELHSFAEYVCENREKYKVKEEYQDEYSPYLRQLSKQEKYARTVPVVHMDKLLKAAEDNLMEYCVLTFLLRMGLTSTEVMQLRMDDLACYANGMYASIQGRKRLCYIPEDVCRILERYMEERNLPEKSRSQPYLFCNRRGNPLNPMYISRMMRRYEEKAGIPHYSAQSVRNSCAVTLFAYGASEDQVADRMGTTKIQIKRYKNLAYQDQLQQHAEQLVKLRVEPPSVR
ncbi:MAG: tyrosine-type recombinase/integrase [Dorea sp.]